MKYQDYENFVNHHMRMSQVYQPVMPMTLLEKGGKASTRDIANLQRFALIMEAPPLPRRLGMLQFESNEVQLKKFRERLRAMTDQELIDYGRRLGRIPRRVSGVPDPFDGLAEARAEWRRRHPKP